MAKVHFSLFILLTFRVRVEFMKDTYADDNIMTISCIFITLSYSFNIFLENFSCTVNTIW